MNVERLNEYLGGVAAISPCQFSLLQLYLSELLRWNKKINLTAIRRESECWEKHIVDSLLIANYLHGDEHLLDIGSGAGLPSIPLKVLFADLSVLSVDSVGKKINFQRHVARLLQLDNYITESVRIESLHNQYSAQFDVVVSRAFASLELFVAHALPFVRSGGKILAMKSKAVDAEIEQANHVIAGAGIHISQMNTFILQPSGSTRVIIEFTKD